jgi:hypothetical protein
MAAHTKFSNNELHAKNTAQKIEMLRTVGINFAEYPEAFRQGTFTRKVKRLVEIDEEVWNRIPEKHRGSRIAERTAIESLSGVPKLTSLTVSAGSFKLFHEGRS